MAPRNTPVAEGELAPALALEDVYGSALTLEQHRGRTVLLAFHRFANCPFCNLRVHRLAERYDELHPRGLEIIAVFESPRSLVREGVARQKLPFAIIADPDRALYREYGVDVGSWAGVFKSLKRLDEIKEAKRLGLPSGPADGRKSQLPSDFVIGPDGRVLRAYLGKDIGDHLSIDELAALLPGR